MNRTIFRAALEAGRGPDMREWATYMVLVARAIERIAETRSISVSRSRSS